MAHKRKKRRTQGPNQPTNAQAIGINKAAAGERVPKSMVIRMGGSEVGSSVSQLVKDVRAMMEPHTASKLRERRSNKLRDYTTMAGPLGVTHFLLFSRSPGGHTNMRLAITPRGPTFSFRVEKYSLARDIAKSQRHPKSANQGIEHVTPPLLVMNNFILNSSSSGDVSSTKGRIPKHLETLATSVFQSLFPPIAPQRTPLSSIRRVLLVNRENSKTEDGTYVINLRHYHITTKPLVALSRGIKRLRQAEFQSVTPNQKNQDNTNGNTASESEGTSGIDTKKKKKKRTPRGGLPDMGQLDDIADYVLDPSGAGYTSASESEMDTDAEVEVAEAQTRKVLARKGRQRQRQNGDNDEANVRKPSGMRSKIQKRAVKLTEIGPRMTLRLVKVEEGLCTGKVLWHEFVEKSSKEVRTLETQWAKKRDEIAERKRIQKENVEKKKAASGKKGGSTKDGEESDELDDENWDEYDDDELHVDQQGVVHMPEHDDDEIDMDAEIASEEEEDESADGMSDDESDGGVEMD